MKNILFSLTFIGILSLPVLGFIYIHYFLGTVLGIVVGSLFFGAWNQSRKAVNSGMTKELMIEIASGISIGHLSAVVIALLVWGLGPFDNIKEPFWSFAPFYYFCVCLPAGGLFGFLLTFCYENFQGTLKDLRVTMNGDGDFWHKYYWDNQKFMLKYLNPITLPFPPIYLLFEYIFKFIKKKWKTQRSIRRLNRLSRDFKPDNVSF